MIASAIRELSASISPLWIAAAFFERTIQIWDVKSRGKISEFPTVFCLGAQNLVLAPSAQILIAGRSTVGGKIAAYETTNGTVLWERKIAYPSSLCFQRSGESIFCTGRNESIFHIDVHTGTVIKVIDGFNRYIDGPYGDALAIPSKNGNKPFQLIGKHRSFEIKRRSFALLDAQFSPDSVCLTEAVGPVRCINSIDGTQRWKFDSGADSHVLRLHYSSKLDTFWGVLGNLAKGGSKHLLQFNAGNGVCKKVCELDSWEEVFLQSVDQLVTSSGEIFDLSNGTFVGRLAFPTKEYPDN